ncbi:class F sortase [Actinoplanes sp. NPDC024001]|uniref:class F sortase n=1 Tax=Actinoplanes sp. NPDC024001 TaxID=3154598 RepID=UPI00340BE03D
MSVFLRGTTSRRSPGRGALLSLVLGVTLAVTAGVAACQAQPEEDFGTPAVSPPPSPPASAAAAGRVPIADGTLPAASGADAPVRLRLPALDLDAAVDAVGIEPSTGDFAVPPSVDRVGWYRYGPGFSAEAGSIVIAGHVDSAAEGEGAFFRLGSLDAGDRVTLAGADGRERQFEVVARKRYEKTAIPLQKYFARDGAVRLTLITCGGPFDPRTRHYRDNVVVTANLRPEG